MYWWYVRRGDESGKEEEEFTLIIKGILKEFKISLSLYYYFNCFK